MEWIVEQRAAAGDWFTRATVSDRDSAEHYACLYKEHNPHLRFRYRRVDECGNPLDDSEPIEVATAVPRER
jgi:hypothetical protein